MSRGNSREPMEVKREPRDREREHHGTADRGELTGDKSTRSVFVGNIPYEATEEKLKEIFSEVGHVVSFKLVYDRENGKPRGYGFCEYQNPETALCAMRNLNGYEIGGRTLRVDSACTERNRMEMQAVMAAGGPSASGHPGTGPPAPGGQPVNCQPGDNGPYGDPVEPEKAPEAISKAVASLPPEQMFELMKQMKMCIGNNPQEARNMLLQNPQLAYALLQAQVVMRIVEPEMALQMLHKSYNPPMSLGMRGEPVAAVAQPPMMQDQAAHFGGGGPSPMGRPFDDRGGGRSSSSSSSYEQREMDQQRFGGRDPRNRDPRAGGGGFDPRGRRDMSAVGQAAAAAAAAGGAGTSTDPARNQLIMQVLQLTDEQIAMLPIEQQTSIMELKKQINQPK